MRLPRHEYESPVAGQTYRLRHPVECPHCHAPCETVLTERRDHVRMMWHFEPQCPKYEELPPHQRYARHPRIGIAFSDLDLHEQIVLPRAKSLFDEAFMGMAIALHEGQKNRDRMRKRRAEERLSLLTAMWSDDW